MTRTTILFLSSLIAVSGLAAGHDVTGPTYGPASYSAGIPAVASNGRGFLALWSPRMGSAGQHVFGSLIDINGNVSPQAFLVAPNSAIIAAFGFGDGYIALLRDVPSALGDENTMRVAFLSGEGKVLSYGSSLDVLPDSDHDIAFNGRRFLIVHKGEGTLISLDGRIVRDHMPLGNGSFVHAVTSIGNDFVVVTGESNGLYVHRLADDGSDVSPKLRFLTDAAGRIAIAASDTDVAVAFISAFDGGSPTFIRSTVTDYDGTSKGHDVMVVKDAARISMLWSGTNYVLVGESYGAGFATRVDRIGTLLDAPGIPFASGMNAATEGKTVFAAGESGTYGFQPPLLGTTLHVDDAGIHAGEAKFLFVTLRRQSGPRIASSFLDYLVTWFDETTNTNIQSAMRIALSGAPLSAAQLDLGNASSSNSDALVMESDSQRQNPQYSVLFGQSVYLIVWHQDQRILAARLSLSGVLLDPQPLVLGTGEGISDQAIAWSGWRFFVAWAGNGTTGVFVTEEGMVTPVVGRGYGGTPSVVWDGHHFVLAAPFVTYAPPLCHCYIPAGVLIWRMAEDGTIIDRSPTKINGWIGRPHLASSGSDVALVVDSSSWEPSPSSILAFIVQPFSETLQVGAPVPVFAWFRETTSDVVWDGRAYVISWRYGAEISPWWIARGRLSQSGSVVFDRAFAETGPPDVLSPPAIAANSPGRTVIAISETSPPSFVGRVRTYTDDEMQPMPTLPDAPTIVSAANSNGLTTVRWEFNAPNPSGFVVESGGYVIGSAGPADRSLTVYKTDFVRVRAFNAAGFSEPSPTTPTLDLPRRRSAHH